MTGETASLAVTSQERSFVARDDLESAIGKRGREVSVPTECTNNKTISIDRLTAVLTGEG